MTELYIQAETNGVWLGRNGHLADGVANVADRVRLTPTRVDGQPGTSTALGFAVPFHLRAADGRYLERTALLGAADDANKPPHYGCSFGLGFVDQPTQTWLVQYDARSDTQGNVLVHSGDWIGLTVGGMCDIGASDPGCLYRRLLTLRGGPSAGFRCNATVSWWQAHERVKFVVDDGNTSARTSVLLAAPQAPSPHDCYSLVRGLTIIINRVTHFIVVSNSAIPVLVVQWLCVALALLVGVGWLDVLSGLFRVPLLHDCVPQTLLHIAVLVALTMTSIIVGSAVLLKQKDE